MIFCTFSSGFIQVSLLETWKTTGFQYFLDLEIVDKELGAYISTILTL